MMTDTERAQLEQSIVQYMSPHSERYLIIAYDFDNHPVIFSRIPDLKGAVEMNTLLVALLANRAIGPT